ncbi:MAG TPA: ABC transporter substrate-binding protein [Alphaproteobacteria bacterium]|nr:ABC transporter substrate-binding protein [Alphaproteobacteria bacterium]
MIRWGRMIRRAILGGALALGLVALGIGGASAAEKVRIGHFSWPGYALFYVAQGENLAPDLEFEFTIIEDPIQLFSLLATDHLDVVLSTIEFGPIAAEQDLPVKLVAYTNISYGTDGIVVHPDIVSAQDLKGQKVAVLEGGLAQIYMAIYLEQNGVKWQDVEMVNLIMTDASAAMISGQVAGGEFWDPWRTQILRDFPEARMVANSLEPYWLETALLADSMFYSNKFIEEHRDTALKTMKALYDSIDFYRRDPAKAEQYMAEGLKFNLSDIELVMGPPNDVPNGALIYVYQFLEAARFCGVAPGDPPFGQRNGQMDDHWRLTNQWWVTFGLMKTIQEPEKGIDCSLHKELYDSGYRQGEGMELPTRHIGFKIQ